MIIHILIDDDWCSLFCLPWIIINCAQRRNSERRRHCRVFTSKLYSFDSGFFSVDRQNSIAHTITANHHKWPHLFFKLLFFLLLPTIQNNNQTYSLISTEQYTLTHATCNDDNNNNKQKHNSFGVIVIILFYFTSFRLSTQNTVFLVLPIFICTQWNCFNFAFVQFHSNMRMWFFSFRNFFFYLVQRCVFENRT